jgi:hypothetical protein
MHTPLVVHKKVDPIPCLNMKVQDIMVDKLLDQEVSIGCRVGIDEKGHGRNTLGGHKRLKWNKGSRRLAIRISNVCCYIHNKFIGHQGTRWLVASYNPTYYIKPNPHNSWMFLWPL